MKLIEYWRFKRSVKAQHLSEMKKIEREASIEIMGVDNERDKLKLQSEIIESGKRSDCKHKFESLFVAGKSEPGDYHRQRDFVILICPKCGMVKKEVV